MIDKIKKIVFILITITMLIIATLIIANQKKEKERDKYTVKQIFEEFKPIEYNSEYLEIKSYLEEYEELCDAIYDKSETEILYSYLQAYDLLDNEYIKEFSITPENLIKKYKSNKGKEKFIIEKMYVRDFSESISLYFIYGKNVNYKTKTIRDNGFIVKRDVDNLTFSIYTYEYMVENKFELNKLNNNMDLTKISKSISKNENNELKFKTADEEIMAKEYFELFKQNAMYNPSSIYDKLDNKYKQENFPEEEAFINHIEEEKDEIKDSYFKSSSVEITENEIIYKIVDTEGRYYIIKSKSILDYTIFIEE